MFKFPEKKIKDIVSSNYLTFQDYFNSTNNRSNEWLSIHRADPASYPDSRMIYSFLIDGNAVAKAIEYLENMGFPFHQVDFYKKDVYDYVTNYRFVLSDDNNFSCLPFIIHRSSNGKFQERIDVIQDFILYHDLRMTNDGNYVYPENDEVVIRFEENFQVDVKEWYLKDFLAAVKMILIKCIVFQREINKPLIDIYPTNAVEKTESNGVNYYHLYINMGPYQNSVASLYGMETVKAYLKPNHSNYKALFGENKKRYLNFIIKINKNGKEILSSCDPKRAYP